MSFGPVASVAAGARTQAEVSGQLDHLEKGLVMAHYAQLAFIAFALLVLAIPLLGIRLMARLG